MATLRELTVDIWYCNSALLASDAVENASCHLSREEINRGDRFRLNADRRDFTVAHDLLRRALSSYTDLSPSDWRFAIDARGKPTIDNAGPKLNGLSFSLSHTQGFVACAVTKKALIGIDVERIDLTLPAQDIADRYFSEEEAQQLRDCSSDLRAVRFTEMWTLKEAFLKAVGVGHFRSPTDVSFRFNEHCNIEFSTQAITDLPECQFALFEPLSYVRMAIALAGSSSPRYFLHPYDGCVFDSFLATPNKQSMRSTNHGSAL